jgi:hypothetical protein
MKMKYFFITFGNKTYRKSRIRLAKEADKLKIFNFIRAYTPKDFGPDFKKQHGSFIKENKRGFGYFIWKSYLINKTLKIMDDNDILVYVDAGCTLIPKFKPRLLEYFDIINQSEYGMLNFNLGSMEYQYTKSDLADKLGVLHDDSIMNAPQVAGGIQIIRKCPHSIDIVEKWCYYSTENYHNIDNSPSIIPNHPDFKEHRHDQSVISLLVKKFGSEKIKDETYPPGTGPISADRIKK